MPEINGESRDGRIGLRPHPCTTLPEEGPAGTLNRQAMDRMCLASQVLVTIAPANHITTCMAVLIPNRFDLRAGLKGGIQTRTQKQPERL